MLQRSMDLILGQATEIASENVAAQQKFREQAPE
jgi:hypothetical protein